MDFSFSVLKEGKMKRYLKSIHTRYMLTFMAIMILTILILGVIITNIVNNFTLDLRLRDINNINVQMRSYFKVDEKDGVLPKFTGENGQIDPMLMDALETMSRQMGVMLFDPEGNLIFSAHNNGNSIVTNYKYDKSTVPEVVVKEKLPQGLLDRMQNQSLISTNDNCYDFFGSEVYYYASAITTLVKIPDEELEKKVAEETNSPADDSDSNTNSDTDTDEIPREKSLLGVVLCYDQGNAEEAKMMHDMMLAIISTLIWITIASLVAIYGVSYYSMRPLREIGQAAKSFSHGKFNVRVKVRGNDELAELAESFNQMAIAVESKDEMQKNFLSNVSHDLKTPMTTIAGFVDGILDGAIPADKQDYYLNIIKNEVKRLSRLVTSLLDISRLQSGERKFEYKQFNICELARQTVLSFENQLEDKKLNVEFDTDDFDMIAYADKDAINQVIYNICHNAIKFSYEGGLYKVSIKYEGNNTIRFTLFNEGIGITSEELPFVFDRFYKSDKSRGLDKTGTGLGLFISKTIIDAHGQTIKVSSEYEKWCEFSFTVARNQKSLPKGENK